MDKYVVMGNPIEHSKSPEIHAAFAHQTGQVLSYEKCLVAVDQFDKACKAFFEEGSGCNVTVPFKENAYHYADELTARATDAGAVNTLSRRGDGIIVGDNTDGVGLVRDIIDNNKGQIRSKRVLVLGAGGAVRGVIGPLLDEKPAAVTIANRTVVKAEALAQQFSGRGEVSGCGFDAVDGAFDIIINGTAASLSGDVPPIRATVIKQGTWCYDMMYGSAQTVFNQWAESHGAARCIDGLGMLIEQAAEAFYIWRGVRPDTSVVIKHFSRR